SAECPGTGPIGLVRRRQIARVIGAEVLYAALGEEDLSADARVHVRPNEYAWPGELRPNCELREVIGGLDLHFYTSNRRTQRYVLRLVAIVDDACAQSQRESPHVQHQE